MHLLQLVECEALCACGRATAIQSHGSHVYYTQEPSTHSSFRRGDLGKTDKEEEEAAATSSAVLAFDSKDSMLLLLEG